MADEDLFRALIEGGGRGSTVLCTIMDRRLLGELATVTGPTGLVLAAGGQPCSGDEWRAIRCAPVDAMPLRSHVVDATVIEAGPAFGLLVEEVRRVLAPHGDLRVRLAGGGDAARAQVDEVLTTAGFTPRRWCEGGAAAVLAARGP